MRIWNMDGIARLVGTAGIVAACFTGTAASAGTLDEVKERGTLVVGVKTDFLFPIHQQRELAEGLEAPGRDVEFVELNSLQGHDSFLVDMDNYRPLLAKFFA